MHTFQLLLPIPQHTSQHPCNIDCHPSVTTTTRHTRGCLTNIISVSWLECVQSTWMSHGWVELMNHIVKYVVSQVGIWLIGRKEALLPLGSSTWKTGNQIPYGSLASNPSNGIARLRASPSWLKSSFRYNCLYLQKTQEFQSGTKNGQTIYLIWNHVAKKKLYLC